MVSYLFLWPLSLLVSLVCYLTNPLVLLFCDEAGELPHFLQLWQTWDDSCNPSDLKTIAPSWLQFNWDRHYYEYRDTTPELAAAGRDRCYCRVIDSHFTTSERLKRYACRVLWLTRNNAYGFSFWLFGRMVDGLTVEVVKQKDDDRGRMTYARDTSENAATAAFLYKNDRAIIPGVIRWCLFFGWKIDYHHNRPERAMIAGRVAVRFGRG